MTSDTSKAVDDARSALENFMKAVNAEDTDAIKTRWFHFPHARIHSGKITLMNSADDYVSPVITRQGQAAEWSRSAWDYIEVIDAGPDKVHFRVQFSRFRTDGSLIGSYKSLYIVSFKDNRWAIQARSSWAE